MWLAAAGFFERGAKPQHSTIARAEVTDIVDTTGFWAGAVASDIDQDGRF